MSENRELDALVAGQVMDFVRHKSGVLLPNDDRLHLWFDHAMQAEADRGELWLRVPRYSESIEAAMQVVEKFIDTGGRVSLRGMRFAVDGMADDYKPGWRVNFYRFRRDVPPGTRFSFDEEDESLPLAICRAALAAVKDQNGE